MVSTDSGKFSSLEGQPTPFVPLKKAVIILNAFAGDHTIRRSGEVVRLTSVNKTSVIRFVNNLIKLRYLLNSE